MFTALIASTYDNLMNYLQALFSIFNAPLFATFIIGMFWKRMTPAAGYLGPGRGHAHRRRDCSSLYKAGGSTSAPTSRSRWWARAWRSWSTRS